MNRTKNICKFREDKVVYQMYLYAKENQSLLSRVANLLHP